MLKIAEEGTGRSVFVFGDQIFNVAGLLDSLIQQQKSDSAVADFLTRSCATIHHGAAQLSPEQQAACPRFASIQDLLPYYREGKLNPAFVQALVCIAHLASFIRDHNTGGRPYPSANAACVSGVCTGALSAAAVSCAWSVASLIPLALHAVAVALRLGALAWDVGTRLAESSDEDDGKAKGWYPPWTAAVAGMAESELQAAIDHLGEEKGLPPPLLPYIGAVVATQHVAVSAPPAVLTKLLAAISPSATTALLPIPGPYHAPHLYTANDIACVATLGGSDTSSLAWPAVRIPIISASRGSGSFSTPAADFSAAINEAVQDCLTRCISIDRFPARIAAHLHLSATTAHQVDFQLTGVASERLEPSVRRLLPYDAESLRPFTSEHVSRPSGVVTGPPGSSSVSTSKTPIAILSASGRFPHADDMAAYWNVLSTGLDTHELVPPSRWNASAHVAKDPKAKNVSGTGFGCWLHNAGLFDTTYFNMSPREAPQVDPAQRLALLTATEALEQAGIVPSRTPSTEKTRVGVYFGSTSNDWMETNSAQNIDAYFIPGGNRAFIPGRINYHFKFSGPSYTIDTACSSSLAALHMACNALWKGEVDTAIVGGTNVLTNPDMTAGLDKGHFLSRTGNCKTFDDGADGYCRGEAVVTLILKRLPDAQSDRDPVQACILGVATNHNAEAESITRPHVGAQKELFQRLLAETGVDANDISYVEMHGTGTQAGDAGETTSVAETLSPLTSAGACLRPSSRPIYIGAAKANIGHGEAAAGVTSIAKVMLMLKHSQIPPHAGIKTTINHKLPNLAQRNTHIARTLTPWPKPSSGPRRVLLNNFSAAGGNTAIILEDAPLTPPASEGLDPRTEHVVVLSAKSAPALNSNLRNLIDWIDGQGPGALVLPRLSYTTTARRLHHRYRVAVMGSDLAQIRGALQKQLLLRSTAEGKSYPVPAKAPSFIFAFTGQGAPYAGMGAELYAQFSSFAADIARYDQLCLQMGFASIEPLFQNTRAFDRVTPSELQLMHVSLQMALFRLWRSFGIQPKAVVGHSLGEYAALYAAGVLSQAQVLHLVGKRARLMEQRLAPGTHAMLVALTSESNVQNALNGHEYEFSCHNGEQNVVLGGTVAEMSGARAVLEKRSIRCQYLNTPFAFHTSQVDPILDDFRDLSNNCEVNQPRIPFISPTYGKVIRTRSDLENDYFVNHCRQPVNISQALTAAKQEGLIEDSSIGIEIGPAAAVTRMIKEQVPKMETFAPLLKGKDTWQLFSEILAGIYVRGVAVDWQKYHQDFKCCQRVLDLPAYGWDLKEHWMQYVHDWSLRKGDAPTIIAPQTAELLSSSLHTEVTNTLLRSTGETGELVMDADLSRSDLHPMVQGHKVYGVPLCTPSVYADIAMTVGNYIKTSLRLPFNGSSAVNVCAMNIQSALVSNDSGKPQILRTVVEYNAKIRSAHCTFSSVNASGKISEQHAQCEIKFIDVNDYRSAIKEKAAHALDRIVGLDREVGIADSMTYRFSKAMIYKMVGQLADFDPKYRGLVAITLNNDTLEAAGSVALNADASGEGKWLGANPAHLDALSQLGGFVMNANEGVDLEQELFVNHGWSSMTLFEKIDPRKTYRSYVQMKEGDGKLWSGDVVLFDDKNNVVGEIGGVALQGVPKRLMSYIVSAANKKVSGHSVPVGAQPSKDVPASARQIVSSTKTRPPIISATAQPNLAFEQTVRKQCTPETKQPALPSIISSALKLVSEEVGVAADALRDDMEFADAGLDSLLSLVICSRLRDELEVEIESSDFLEASTIAGLKSLLRKQSVGSDQSRSIGAIQMSESVASVPIPIQDPVIDHATATSVSIAVTKSVNTVVQYNEHEVSQSAGWTNAKKILAEESGIAENDIVDHLVFADIGIDSILSLVICSRLRDELDVDLPDRALFEDCLTIADLRKHIAGTVLDEDSVVSTHISEIPDFEKTDVAATTPTPPELGCSSSDSSSGSSTPLHSSYDQNATDGFVTDLSTPFTVSPGYLSEDEIKLTSPSTKIPTSIQQEKAIPPAWSMFLQGSPKRSKQTLFLFPDGCGAATSYLHLPNIDNSIALVGFNSPFMKKSEEMCTRTLQEVVQSYVGGVRARQPHGPYTLGGWSAGGILAYAVAQELIAAGEEVASLILIDSPPPNKGLDRLPDRFFDHCTRVGIFGNEMQRSPNATTKVPEWLMPHFKASIELLHDYHAPPLPRLQSSQMKVSIIWAGDCAFDGIKYPRLSPATLVGEDTEGMKFLSERRADFGPGEWAKLFTGVHDIHTGVIAGEHHFSMMRGAGAEKLALILRERLR